MNLLKTKTFAELNVHCMQDIDIVDIMRYVKDLLQECHDDLTNQNDETDICFGHACGIAAMFIGLAIKSFRMEI